MFKVKYIASIRALFGLCFFGLGISSMANNIQVSNVTTTGQDLNNDFTKVQFDIGWENSWRISTGPSNWDAAWVFVKFQVGLTDPNFTGVSSTGTTITVSSTSDLRVGMPVRVTAGTGAFATATVITNILNSTQFVVSAAPTSALSNATITCQRIWEHASLNPSSSSHTAPTGSTISAPADGKGVFIYRTESGSGTFALTNVQLQWQYGADLVSDDQIIQVKVFAIEMVYVPQGSFSVGSGGRSRGEIFMEPDENDPYLINSEAAITVGGANGNLNYRNANNSTFDNAGPIPADFPKGFAAFYCMKYEMSQRQYRDFLNILTRRQQDTRTATSLGETVTSVSNRYVMSNTNSMSARNTLRCPASIQAYNPITFYCDFDGDGIGDEATDGEWIAAAFISWSDGCAFLDWAGLRPMTELEFEKAARGSLTPVPNEYAWGSITITSATGISNAGLTNEISSNTAANVAGQNVLSGPLRVGAYAKTATSREQAGAGYYGILELSGNLWERPVSIGNATGRAYTGIHGDGLLSVNGHANTALWPGLTQGEVSTVTALGTGFKGGGFEVGTFNLETSGRDWATNNDIIRWNNTSMRGVRSVL